MCSGSIKDVSSESTDKIKRLMIAVGIVLLSKYYLNIGGDIDRDTFIFGNRVLGGM